MTVFGFREEQWVTVDDVTVLAVTDRAILITHDDLASTGVWIPLSQIDEDSEIDGASDKGATGTLIITQYIATAKGLD